MKIITQGKSLEEVERIRKKTKRFGCSTCNCVFEADEGEYNAEEEYTFVSYFCICPNCGDRAYEQMRHG